MADFLLELLSEEVPARMQAKARNDLARLFSECTEEAGLSTGNIDVFSTPRRLALIARDVAQATDSTREELKGPRTSAPPQALEGFLRKTGFTREQLHEHDGVYFALIERPGRPAAEILADTITRIVADFPWPKSMRWGGGSLRWVRPLHGIVAILSEEIVPVEIEGIASGATTVGHRFHHPGPITIGGAADYVEKLRACHVIVDQEEREALIRDGATAAASAAGLTLLPDEGLVVENAGLTEWPVPLVGRFDPEYLDVPREVIVLTMRTNQKYFACTNDEGLLAPAFVCVANIAAKDGGEAIAEGNARVLAARLADARFFWEQDVKVPLEEQAKKLRKVVFHERLGTLLDKTRRVGLILSTFIQRPRTLSSSVVAFRLARLTKADLMSRTVGEFPELQGVIGGYLAHHQGLTPEVQGVVRNQYQPAGSQGLVPSERLEVFHNLADNLDGIVSFFAVGLKPTGSRDPFAVRRSALSLIRLTLESNARVSLRPAIGIAVMGLGIVATSSALRLMSQRYDFSVAGAEKELDFDDENKVVRYHGQTFPIDEDIANLLRLVNVVSDDHERIAEEVFEFLIDRLKVQQREAGVRHDLIDAVFALSGEDDLVRLLARVNALQKFVETEDGADLLTAYRRAANILKKEKWEGTAAAGGADVAREEQALIAALGKAEPEASAAIDKEDFTAAMAALASLRRPIDDFFDHVTVNDPDPAKRERRLNLLMRFRDAVNCVADFSKIEG